MTNFECSQLAKKVSVLDTSRIRYLSVSNHVSKAQYFRQKSWLLFEPIWTPPMSSVSLSKNIRQEGNSTSSVNARHGRLTLGIKPCQPITNFRILFTHQAGVMRRIQPFSLRYGSKICACSSLPKTLTS